MSNLPKTLNWRSVSSDIGTTKVSLKAENKRLRKQTMLFVVLFALLLPVTQQAKLSDFIDTYVNDIDLSSMKTCVFLGGESIDLVDPGDVDKGHKCTVDLPTVSDDERHAKEVCSSRIPYYITAVKHGKRTKCTFQINLKCKNEGYQQIHGKCYKVTKARFTWQDAQSACHNEFVKDFKPQVANYYYSGLQNYFWDITGVYDAWVSVPELKDYFENPGNYKAFYVDAGAYKYDARSGDLLLDDPNQKHQVLCEYTPPMTRAEMFYLANVYSEIYPIEVFAGGAIIPSANMDTIQQVGPFGKVEHFSTKVFDEKCLSIGRIFNVESYPITALEEEFNDVKDHLTSQRFFLTNAYKNDGCHKGGYRQVNHDGKAFQVYKKGKNDNSQKGDFCDAHSFSLHQTGRYPTMASARAPVLCTLHTFNWNHGACPAGPKWSSKPVTFKRAYNTVFCHYINDNTPATNHEAQKRCEEFGTGLTGFDSAEEFEAVRKELKPQYPPGEGEYYPRTPYRLLSSGTRKVNGISQQVDDHYWLGGVSPCETHCFERTGEREIAGWNDAVAINNSFLNTYNHNGWAWKIDGKQFVSFRTDNNAFHVHKPPNPYTYMFFVCGVSAPLERSEKQRGKVQ
ncbi:hypothetical protein L3Y34_016117 [Caenorhabditis briggsae]|nr:hypothetical protein L3Y34_016117 [Caenorhabditis briggsae]